MSLNKLFVGPVVHTTSISQFHSFTRAALEVKDGKIISLTELPKSASLEDIKKKYNVSADDVTTLQPGEFLMPGLIDTHIHAPQYPNAGLGYDKTLLDWLDIYTFPLESQFGDMTLAAKVYGAVVKRTLNAGTTTACYFATIHKESAVLLAQLTTQLGQRALVGKVNMNMNHPPYYGETTEQSVRDTEAFILEVQALKNPQVQPVITPRFAITCDRQLMDELGALAAKYDVHIQTHVAENLDEIEFVKELFPESKNYCDVYDKSNLLTPKTLLAHGVYLEDEELTLLAERSTAVAHCANSNNSLKSGMCDVRRLVNNNVKVGLGSDCSGGYGHSVMDAMRHSLATSISLSFNNAQKTPLNYQEVLYLATLGGAQALALDSTVGNFEVGKDFDALIINMNKGPSELLRDDYTIEELVQKFVYLSDDRNVTQIYVGGKLVKEI